MALKEVYDSVDDIPEVHRELYAEAEVTPGVKKLVFNGVEGVAGTAAQKRLRDEAGAWRIKHKEATSALTSWSSLGYSTPDEARAALDRIPELETAAEAGGSKSAEAVTKQVEVKLATEKTKWEREIAPIKEQAQKAAAKVEYYEKREVNQTVRDTVLKAIQEFKGGKLEVDAIEDALMYAERHFEAETERDENDNLVIRRLRTKDGVGITPDVEAGAWLAEMVGRKQHWLMASEGGGANPNPRGGPNLTGNPWSAGAWNATAQGAYVLQHGAAKGEQMAKVAGTTLGGPPPKGKNSPQQQEQRRR